MQSRAAVSGRFEAVVVNPMCIAMCVSGYECGHDWLVAGTTVTAPNQMVLVADQIQWAEMHCVCEKVGFHYFRPGVDKGLSAT